MQNYDIIWIGTGQATGTVVPKLSQAGKTVAIAEGGRFGGTCINYGCTPTKALVASARAAHLVRRGADFGVDISDFDINFDTVMARHNNLRDKQSQGMQEWLGDLNGVELFTEFAQFEDEHTVSVGQERITGDTIVINTGARARQPQINGLDEVEWLDNKGVLDLKVLPHHLVIIGGSYIGMEFGQAFRRFGSAVTILEKGSQLMFREDADIAKAARKILENEDIAIHLETQIQGVAKTPNGVRVDVQRNGTAFSIEGSHLLVATGRQPNTDNLNLDAARIEQDKHGYIKVNDVVQTNVPHIYAVGDVNRHGAFTHTSVHDGQIFWDHYSGHGDRTLSERVPIYNMYIDPPLGRVGMSEKEARQSERRILTAMRPMSRVSRAVEKDETAGLIKMFVDAETEEILGATILGVSGDEIISTIAAFMVTHQSYKVLQRAVLPHPTVAEILPWILDDLQPL